MAAVLKPRVPTDNAQASRSKPRKRAHLSAVRSPAPRQSRLAKQQPAPVKLAPATLHPIARASASGRGIKALSILTGVSSLVAGGFIALALGTYGYTVYIDRQLNSSIRHLERLQRSEQQLTTVNEVLKNHMAEQAERPSAGFKPPQPTNVIFLPRPAKSLPAPAPAADSGSRSTSPFTPLGY